MAEQVDIPDELTRMPPSKRGVARKTAILDAALRIIARDGMSGLSMRSVAAEAKIPLGAMGYYFDGKDDLIATAFQRHTQRETKRVVRTISRLHTELTPDELANRLADFIIDGLTQSREKLIAEYEFLVESTRRPDLERTSTAWQQSLLAQLHAVMTAINSSSPNADARLILAVMAGMEIDNLAAPLNPTRERTIRAVVQRLVHAIHASSTNQSTGPPSGDQRLSGAS